MKDTELREIDAQVHCEVMGIVWDESRCRGCGWPIVSEGEQGCWASNCSMRPCPDHRADEPPHYSSSIAAAWQVVERIRTWSGGQQDAFYDAICDQWHDDRGRFVPDESPDALARYLMDSAFRWFLFRAPSQPLAICRAALKAVRGDMGQSVV